MQGFIKTHLGVTWYDAQIFNKRTFWIHGKAKTSSSGTDARVWVMRHRLTLVMQQDEARVVLLVTAESDGDLVAPAAQHKAPHQNGLVGKDVGFSATCVLHRHLLPLQHTHI